jgi:Mg2+-importing ATPase
MNLPTDLPFKPKFEHSLKGLSDYEVLQNRRKFGANIIKDRHFNIFSLFMRQITGNPLLLVLITATVVSKLLGDNGSSNYILGMIFLSIALGFWNEYSAERTVEALTKRILNKITVLRDGKKRELLTTELVVGDIVFVGPGNIIPADLTPIEAKNLEVNEAVLTGESNPVYKTNETLFMGTVVLGGYCKGCVLKVGRQTQFGKIAQDVSFIKPSTDFQKGLASFSKMLVNVILLLTVGIFAINFLLGRSALNSLLFSLAIAVGLTPELLPVIVTVSLSHGAGKLAKHHVIAKQLISLENLGNMDVLCTDKTGTLTEGKIELVEVTAHSSVDTLEYALICNSAVVEHKIMGNPIDSAIWHYAELKGIKLAGDFRKIEEEPFDYETKGSYTVFERAGVRSLVVKGAPEEILKRCTGEMASHTEKFEKLSEQGYRVIAVAHKKIAAKKTYGWDDAAGLEFAGFLSFMDVPKKKTKEALGRLARLNVAVKVLTGDNEIITRKICSEVNLEIKGLLTGRELSGMSEETLRKEVEKCNVFAMVTPDQKLQIIRALKLNAHTVGYLGDGVNDIPSLHNADVGISVDTAIDVAKNAANIVLLQKNLDVIVDGIVEGRRTFNNTIKYILMGTSSNFGNMFSASIASFILPFLPMTPAQILLNNSLYDISQMSIPSDNVDEESLKQPKHWNISFIRSYMVFFGPISSLYDFLTFGVLFYVFHAKAELFHTGWFIESLATQIFVVFVIRTSRSPFYKSKPGIWLTLTCWLLVIISMILPYTPIGVSLGFVAPPLLYFVILIVMIVTYLALVEFLKKIFLKKFSL